MVVMFMRVSGCRILTLALVAVACESEVQKGKEPPVKFVANEADNAAAAAPAWGCPPYSQTVAYYTASGAAAGDGGWRAMCTIAFQGFNSGLNQFIQFCTDAYGSGSAGVFAAGPGSQDTRGPENVGWAYCGVSQDFVCCYGVSPP
jgi:hypothetical protein